MVRYSPDGVLVNEINYSSKLIKIKCLYKCKTHNINELMSNLTYIKVLNKLQMVLII